MTTHTPERLAEIETIYGPIPPAVRKQLTDLLAETDKAGIDHPSAIFGGELHAIWQGSSGRITVYVTDDGFLVEVVPWGPIEPFRTKTAEAAAAYMRGLLTKF